MAGAINIGQAQSVLDIFADLDDFSSSGKSEGFDTDEDLLEFEKEEACAQSSGKNEGKASANLKLPAKPKLQETESSSSSIMDFAASGVKEMAGLLQDTYSGMMVTQHNTDYRNRSKAGGYRGASLQVCPAFQIGMCRDGMSCQFVHEGAFRSGSIKENGSKGVFDPEDYIRQRLSMEAIKKLDSSSVQAVDDWSHWW